MKAVIVSMLLGGLAHAGQANAREARNLKIVKTQAVPTVVPSYPAQYVLPTYAALPYNYQYASKGAPQPYPRKTGYTNYAAPRAQPVYQVAQYVPAPEYVSQSKYAPAATYVQRKGAYSVASYPRKLGKAKHNYKAKKAAPVYVPQSKYVRAQPEDCDKKTYQLSVPTYTTNYYSKKVKPTGKSKSNTRTYAPAPTYSKTSYYRPVPSKATSYYPKAKGIYNPKKY